MGRGGQQILNGHTPCRVNCHFDAPRLQTGGPLLQFLSQPGAYEAVLASPRAPAHRGAPMNVSRMSTSQKLEEVWHRLPHYLNKQTLKQEVAELLAPQNIIVMVVMFDAAVVACANPLGALAVTTAGIASLVFAPKLVLAAAMGVQSFAGAENELDLEKAAFHFANVIMTVGLLAFLWIIARFGKLQGNAKVRALFARLKRAVTSTSRTTLAALAARLRSSHFADLTDMGISPKIAQEFSKLSRESESWMVVKDSNPESIPLANTRVGYPKPFGVAAKTDKITGVATATSEAEIQALADEHFVVRSAGGRYVAVNKAGRQVPVESNPAWNVQEGQVGRIGPEGKFQPYVSDQDLMFVTTPGTTRIPAPQAETVPGVKYPNLQSSEARQLAAQLDAQLPSRLQMIQHGEQVHLDFIPRTCRAVAFGPEGQIFRLESAEEVQTFISAAGRDVPIK